MTLKSDFVIKLRDYALMNCSNEKSQGLLKEKKRDKSRSCVNKTVKACRD